MKAVLLCLVALFAIGLAEITPIFPDPQPIPLTSNSTAPPDYQYYYDFEEKIVIDPFDYTSDPILVFIIPSGGAPPTVSQSTFDQDSSILGGERDIILVVEQGDESRVLTAGASGGEFTLTLAQSAGGVCYLQFDGVDGSENLDSAVGLGGLDFTADGSAFGILLQAFSDLDTSIVVTICSTGSVCDSQELVVPEGNQVTDYLVEFAGFSSSIDFTSISAVEFTINPDAFDNVDFAMETIAVIGDVVFTPIGGDCICNTVPPCETYYYRLETLTDVHPDDYLKITFNTTGADDAYLNSWASFYMQSSRYTDLQSELESNENIQSTLGELPSPTNYLYKCDNGDCEIEITYFLDNTTYYLAINGGEFGYSDFCFCAYLRQIPIVEIFDRVQTPVFFDQRATLPPDDRALTYTFYAFDVPEDLYYSEGTFITVELSRVQPFPGLSLQAMYGGLPEYEVDEGVIGTMDDFDAPEGNDVDLSIFQWCVDTIPAEGCPAFDYPIKYQERIPCQCFTDIQTVSEGTAFQLACQLTVDPCHFQYGTWYFSVGPLPERSDPYNEFDVSGFANYTITAKIVQPLVTTLFRGVTFKGFVDLERLTHYKINVDPEDISYGRTHMVVSVSGVRGAVVDISVHQGQGPTMDLAGIEGCTSQNATCTTSSSCNLVIEKCHFVPGTWYISVGISYDPETCTFDVCDEDRLPATYTIVTDWYEDPTPVTLTAGSAVSTSVGEALYDFYVIEIPHTIDTWLFVELFAKAEDTEVIISMLHGALPGGECYERPDFYCLTGDPRGETVNQRESCQFMIQTCELEAGPLYISVYGHHVGYGAYGDNTFYGVPVHYTLYVDFDTALAVGSGESYSENVYQNHYQHYYIRADDVEPGSFLTVEVTNIRHGIPQTIEAFVNFNFLAGNCPCYDHMYNCTGVVNPNCNADYQTGPNAINFVNEYDSVDTCCTIIVPPHEFASGVWYISVLGMNEDMVEYTTPIGYTLTVTINPAPVYNPLFLGQAETSTVPQWNLTLEYANYMIQAKPVPLNDLVLKIAYVQNCEYNEKHDNVGDVLSLFVKLGAPASMYGWDMMCNADIFSSSFCTITIPHCMWVDEQIYIAIQGNYDAILPARFTLRAWTEEIRDVALTANVPYYDRVSYGRYRHYFIDMAGNEDEYLAIDIYTNQDQDPITAYLAYETRAGDSPCFTNMASCWTQTSCWWQLEACEIMEGRYYISVYGSNSQFYDIPTEYTITANVKTVASRIGNGDPVTGAIQVGEIQHYRYTVALLEEGDYLLFTVDNVQHGSVAVYHQTGYLAGRCPCYLYEQSCWADSDSDCAWCSIRVDPCMMQSGDHFFSVVGIENKTPTPPMYQTAIGYTVEVEQIRPNFYTPRVDVGRNTANTMDDQTLGNGRYNHYMIQVDSSDFASGFHYIVEITNVLYGELNVYFQAGFPADMSCNTAQLCPEGIEAGSECHWQIPYCLTRPDDSRPQYISVEGMTGRLTAQYSILIWKQEVPSIVGNPSFTLDNQTSSLSFPPGAELNVTHYYENEPNGWTRFIRLEDVATDDPEGGDILELFFYRINNNVGQPTSFNVYVYPEAPAGAHECCDGMDMASCQGAPCSNTVDTTAEAPFPGGSEVFTHTCVLDDGLGPAPVSNSDPFYGYRCTVRVWACEFNKYCANETKEWWLSVVPVSPSASTPNQALPGLSYSVQWRVRSTRLDEQNTIDSIDLTTIVNSYDYTNEYTLFNPDTETDDFLSFYVDMEIDDNLQRRLVIQTDFTSGDGIVYIKRATTNEFANPTSTCYDYECAWNSGPEANGVSWCAGQGRFILSECCSINSEEAGGRWWITVRNVGPSQSSVNVRFRITEITMPYTVQIPDHPSFDSPFVVGSSFLDVDSNTIVPGLQGEKYDFYAIIMDDDDLDDHESLIIDMTRVDNAGAEVLGYLNIYVRFGAEAGDFNGYNRGYYEPDPEGCYMFQYMCSALAENDRCTFQIPACQMLEGYWYISIFNPVFDFGPGPVTELPQYELVVYVQDAPTTLTLESPLELTDTAMVNNPPGTYMHFRVNVTASDLDYDDRSLLDGYYTNWLRFQIGNVTEGTVTMLANYGDLAGFAEDYICLNNFDACTASALSEGCYIDVLPCPYDAQRLLSGEYFISLLFSEETNFQLEAVVLSNEYSQITSGGALSTNGTDIEVFQVTAADAAGDEDFHYRYVIDLTDSEGDDDGFADNEYAIITITTDEESAPSDVLLMTVWRDDCTRWECTLVGPDSNCTIDALGLAPCTLKGGRFYFDVYNPNTMNFTLTMTLYNATIQTLGQDVVIVEDTEPYMYQEYLWEAIDVLDGATLEITICSICGDVEAWLRPDGPAGPGPAVDGSVCECNIDYGRTYDNDDEFEFDDDVDCFSFFLDTCEYQERPYYVAVRGVTRSFPSATNSNITSPIRYEIWAHQTNVNFTQVSFQCAETLSYYEPTDVVPRQYTVDLETANVGESLRFSMMLPWTVSLEADATLQVSFNQAAGYTADCENWWPYSCTISAAVEDASSGSMYCDFIIPACEVSVGKYYIWADAPRGTQIIVERFDPVVQMMDQNRWYTATINGNEDSTYDLPYRPARQYYRVDIAPPGKDDEMWNSYYEKFFVRFRLSDISYGTVAMSVNSGNMPAVDEYSADCGSPVFWDNWSCTSVGCNQECYIDVQLADIYDVDSHDYDDDDDGHYHIPSTFWVAISGVSQDMELQSIEYSLVAQTNWVITYYDVNTTICNTVEEGEYNFHRLRPKQSEIPQSSILHLDILDLDWSLGEQVTLLLNDGSLATLEGSDMSVTSGTADAEDGSIHAYWYCGYNDLYLSVYGNYAADAEIDYLMRVTKEEVPVRELFIDSVFHMDDDDDDMCPHDHDFFIFKSVAPNGNFRSSFLRVTVDSDCPVEVWVNKHTIAWGPCHDTAHGTNGGSGSVDLYDFCDYEDTNYYITVQSNCHYYIYTDVRDDAEELVLGEVFRDELEPCAYQMYTLEVCEDWFEADDRLVVEITDVTDGAVRAWIQLNSNPGPIFDLDDDSEELEDSCSLGYSAYAEYGAWESGYDFLLVDSAHLNPGTYHILVQAACRDDVMFDDDDCEHTKYRIYPYLVDYEIEPMTLELGVPVSGSLDMYRIDRFETDSLRLVDYYMVQPLSTEDGYMDFVSFAQARVADVQGGEVMLRVMCGHLATPTWDYINGSRQALTKTGEIDMWEIQSGRRPYDYQQILDPYTSWINPQCTGAADFCCQTGWDVDDDGMCDPENMSYDQSCSLFIPSCYWDIKDQLTFYLSVEVIQQDYMDHPVNYTVVIDQYEDFTLIQPNTNRLSSFENDNWEYDFFWSVQSHTESARWRVVVTDGEGVLVTVRNHRCPIEATWEKSIWCDAQYWDNPWMCDIEIPTEAAHPGDKAFFITVMGKDASYSIAYWRGRENCHLFSGEGRADGLDFCAGVVPYATWRWDDYDKLDNEAECFFEELYEHFRVQPCWSGVTPECNATLQRFACYESFHACDDNGFMTGTCRRACEAVVYECVNWFDSVDLEHYNCTSSRYLDDDVGTCTGMDLFANFVPNSVTFLGNPDLLLFAPSPDSYSYGDIQDDAASSLSVSYFLMLAVLAIFALL